jgi:thymidylate synthase
MHVVKARGINDAVKQLIHDVHHFGTETKSDKGTVKEINRLLLEIERPVNRYLCIPGRKNNIYAMIAETMWVLSGTNLIEPLLSAVLPRAKDFSDDGVSWRAGYGPRLYKDGQLDTAINRLRKSPATRQSVISIYDPALDTDSAIHAQLGVSASKDVPCNNMLYLYTDPDNRNRLNLSVIQRSGDALWGFGSINIFEWSFLQEVVASVLGMDVGTYAHYCNNTHIYYDKPVVLRQVQDIVANTDAVSPNMATGMQMDIGVIHSAHDIRMFFNLVCQVMGRVAIKELDREAGMSAIRNVFETYRVARTTNKLWHYCELVVAQLTPEEEEQIDLSGYSQDLINAVCCSTFTKFKYII